jgi:tetratricopeptide (TPR) repeat protein
MRKFAFLTLMSAVLYSCGGSATQQADKMLEQEKYDEAIKLYTEYLETHPKEDLALANRATAYFKRAQARPKADSAARAEDFALSLADYQAAGKVKTDNTDYLNAIASCHLELKNYEQAIIAASRAVEINPNNIRSYFFRAKAYERLVPAKTVSAREDYNKIISLDPKNSEAYLFLGVMEGKIGKLEEACKQVTKALELGNAQAEKAKQKYCK